MSVLDIKKPNRTLAYRSAELAPEDISDEEYLVLNPSKGEDFVDLPRVKHRLEELKEEYEKRVSGGADATVVGSKRRKVRWIDHQSSSFPSAGSVPIEDEFKRELSFYTSALTSTKEALAKLTTLQIPVWRPDDYLTDMFKTDQLMGKVKQNVMDQQKRVQVVEDRKKHKRTKKFAAEAHQQEVAKRTQRKIQETHGNQHKKMRPGKDSRHQAKNRRR
jgi:hypothetical protein